MASVQLDRVRKTFGKDTQVIKDVNLEIAPGEFCVFLGPSGCGKSTLLRMVAGIEDVTAGDLAIGGVRMNEVPAAKRQVAMVFQSYALYPHMTVAENLAFGLKLRKHDKATIERRVNAAAETLGLSPMLDKLPREMSGGQRQRVALGRALVREPSVFLLDEPLSNLDAKLRHSVRTEIGRLHRQLGATMIYVTHDQVEAMTLGQRIVVLKDGEIQQIDTPMALYEKPANLFVAGFLGSPAMNVLQGSLRVADGLHLVLDNGASLPLSHAFVSDAWLGQRVAVGVRPEHLLPAGIGKPAFEAQVELIEPVGNEVFVNLVYAGQTLVARMPPQRLPEPGETLRVTVEGATPHLFDPDTGLRLP